MRGKLNWIMSFPFGVKSNIPLTNFLGTSIVNLINFVEYFTTILNNIEVIFFRVTNEFRVLYCFAC